MGEAREEEAALAINPNLSPSLLSMARKWPCGFPRERGQGREVGGRVERR